MTQLRMDVVDALVNDTLRDGFCILRNHFPREILSSWKESFSPLLERHIAREADDPNRGPNRYYVTLPFESPFADPFIYEDEGVLAVVRALVGHDAIMCQLATDTPTFGSDYQNIHRDAPPLFPETGSETPPFQLAVNFPLVDVTAETGPFEVARGTHMMSKEEGLRRIRRGEADLEPILMNVGDVMIRDVRGLHRGTPNRTDVPRPMVVIGYSRRWLYRPEVSIKIPRGQWERLSEGARFLLRFNPIVESLKEGDGTENYRAYAY